MNESPDDIPSQVGQQLAKRRDELDLTQDALARRIGVTVTSVSAAERGRSTIIRSKRATWEQALGLKAGTLTRAYRDGTPIEVLDRPEEPEIYADLSDKHERAVWEMERLSEEDRRTMIDILRAGRAEERRRIG